VIWKNSHGSAESALGAGGDADRKRATRDHLLERAGRNYLSYGSAWKIAMPPGSAGKAGGHEARSERDGAAGSGQQIVEMRWGVH